MTYLKNKKVAIVAHVLTTVPAEDLKEFLLSQNVSSLLFISHPIFYQKDRPGSTYQLYKDQKIVKKIVHKNIPLPSLISYIKDFFLTIFWVLKSGQKWDVLIALDNLNTFTALVLKIFKRVDKVVYYTIDFTPNRFSNSTLNNIYHWIDKISVKYADRTWNLTERMAEGREKIRGLKRDEYSKQIVAPIGIWFSRIKRPSASQINKHTLIYTGGLAKHQGIQLMLEALPLVIKEVPDVSFVIVGMGDYYETLLKLVEKLGVSKHVIFEGYKETHDEVEQIAVKGALGIALYDEEFAKWSYYGDPSKIKTYLASGLPVITTTLTHMAYYVTNHECGKVVSYNKTAVAKAVVTILKDDKLRLRYRENAIACAKEFDWTAIYTKAFTELYTHEY